MTTTVATALPETSYVADGATKRVCCSRPHCPNGEFGHTVGTFPDGRHVPYETARPEPGRVWHRCVLVGVES